MPDKDGYPSKDEIRKLKRLCKLDFFKQENVDYFLDYLEDIWWNADCILQFGGHLYFLWVLTFR